jgi:hypothetical protein
MTRTVFSLPAGRYVAEFEVSSAAISNEQVEKTVAHYGGTIPPGRWVGRVAAKPVKFTAQ